MCVCVLVYKINNSFACAAENFWTAVHVLQKITKSRRIEMPK